LSGAAAQATRIVPGWSATVVAARLPGRPGTVNGTTVLLTGDAVEPAPFSLTATTVNAYCVPYCNSPAGSTSCVVPDSPAGALAPVVIAVTAYLAIL
jgi:hypothetical protein